MADSGQVPALGAVGGLGLFLGLLQGLVGALVGDNFLGQQAGLAPGT